MDLFLTLFKNLFIKFKSRPTKFGRFFRPPVYIKIVIKRAKVHPPEFGPVLRPPVYWTAVFDINFK
ncbi:hypothetical protein BpHYR1_012944 [Brachionus plicatilis]|uniref:Uncharacterized protein n=1 Tax=Brachionus plicatilis TaxID=10195 RepID=A0A3M7SP86_BRAPC|nr:hypothetical protein BpHYR1_012944 [Brachionus plicatilis]